LAPWSWAPPRSAALELGEAEVGALELGEAEVGALELGAAEVGALELGQHKDCFAEVRLA
jgi:hypothetical protein